MCLFESQSNQIYVGCIVLKEENLIQAVFHGALPRVLTGCVICSADAAGSVK
jgi:hypothetical protein